MKNKKLLKFSFFLLLIGLFVFLEVQISREEKGIEEKVSKEAVSDIEPVAHIAIEQSNIKMLAEVIAEPTENFYVTPGNTAYLLNDESYIIENNTTKESYIVDFKKGYESEKYKDIETLLKEENITLVSSNGTKLGGN